MKATTIDSLLKALTWGKILQVATVVFIIGLTYGLWDSRVTLYNSIKVGARVETDQPLVMNLSSNSTNAIDDYTEKMKSTIAGIQVFNVNFKKNTKSSAYFSISQPALKKGYELFLNNKVTDIPVFTNIELHNQRIINLINGEFICVDYKDTNAAKYMPTVTTEISTVCSISIPEYYGRFTGYLDIYLIKTPSKEEIGPIHQIARELSLKIFENDVDKKSQSTGNK